MFEVKHCILILHCILVFNTVTCSVLATYKWCFSREAMFAPQEFHENKCGNIRPALHGQLEAVRTARLVETAPGGQQLGEISSCVQLSTVLIQHPSHAPPIHLPH